MRFPGSTPTSHTSLNQMMSEGNESPSPGPAVTGDSSTSLDGVVMSGAIGSKDPSPKGEEDKQKQREKTA
jgi:serine/threonine-protein kinase SRPK3